MLIRRQHPVPGPAPETGEELWVTSGVDSFPSAPIRSDQDEWEVTLSAGLDGLTLDRGTRLGTIVPPDTAARWQIAAMDAAREATKVTVKEVLEDPHGPEPKPVYEDAWLAEDEFPVVLGLLESAVGGATLDPSKVDGICTSAPWGPQQSGAPATSAAALV